MSCLLLASHVNYS
jgi:hypothetical protein